MLKSLFLAALVASIFYIVSSTKTGCQSSATPSSTSSSSYSSSSSSASSSSSSSTYQSRNPPDSDDDDNCGTDDDDDDNKGKCKENETYVDCPDYSCNPQSCDQIGYPVACPDPAPNATCPGKPGCICKSGYVRNKKGVCIPTNQCPSCGGDPHATGGCSNYCGHQCSDYNKKPAACALFCIINGCACKTKYVYDSNIEKCVLPKDCTPVCESNEVYSNCTNGGCFGARKCSEKGIPVRCVKLDPKKCKKGCLCKDGYLRDDNGKCVKEDKCGGCSKPHEVYDPCPAKCPFRTCGIDDRVVRCAAPPEVGSPDCPPPTCRCDDGYFRSNNGDCVTWDECPKCGENEVYDGCANGGCYGARNCSEIGKPVICVDLIEGACKGACICKDKYLRNDNGDCIPESKCPKKPVCGENEVYSNCTNGGCFGARKCSEKGQPIRCVKLDPKNCKRGCLCADGYLRDDNGKCIPEDQCGGSSCSKPNEVYDPCPAKCPYRTCGIDDRLILCAPQDKNSSCLPPTCRCQDGFFRNNDGDCVTWDECPKCTKSHEVYTKCIRTCPPDTCESIGINYFCPAQNASNCKTGCVCETGYYRNHIGQCISKSDCLKCTGPNEYYTCGGACDNVCATLKKQNQTNCPIVNKKCNEMCYCYEGYARNASNVCVPFDQCPKSTNCTKPHEVYKNCTWNCPPNTCESIGKSYSCPLQSDSNCKPACVCENGYYRNHIGECISEANCLNCTGPNEYYSCGGACDNVCATLKKQNQTNCPIVNIKCNEMCYCYEGYARNASNICVPFDQCPESTRCTGEHEYYDDCPPSCSPETCDSIGKNITCLPSAAVCRPSCRCEKGYYRNSKNKCVLEKDCDTACPDGEIYNTCPPEKCDAEYCPKSRNSPYACKSTKNCGPPRCTCGFNQKRDRKTGKCIAIADCPPFKCNGPNEEYDSCPPSCPGQNCSDYINHTTCPKYNIKIVVPCKPQCRCKQDYYRATNGICVTASECESDDNCEDDEDN